MNTPFRLIALSVVLLQGPMLGALSPQGAPAINGNVETPVIRVTTRLVQVNVVVQNKKGEPATDLTKEDFTLLDNGQEQKILFFSKESSAPPAANLPPLAPGVVSNRYTNFTVRGEQHLAPLPSSLTVILLDGLNTAFLDQHYAKAALIKFLNQLQPGDRVAIYTLTDELRVLHDFSSDTSALLAALAKYRNRDSSALSASTYEDADTGNETLDAFMDQSNDTVATFYQARRAQTTLEAMSAIAQHLSGMSGRKNLIWLSGSFPLVVGQGPDGAPGRDFQTFSNEMQRSMRTLNDSGIAIYPVDARGLMGASVTMPSFSAEARGRGAARGGGRAGVDVRAQNQVFQTQGAMREIADRTGGRAFMNTNDLAGAIHRAMDDARVTYVLGYSPSHEQWDNKFREIKIKLKRPGLEARYRRGYFAYSQVLNAADPKQRLAILGDAAAAPLASTGLGMAATIAESPTRDRPRGVVQILVDPHDVYFDKTNDGKYDANVDLLVVVFDDRAKAVRQVQRTLHLNMDEATYANALKSGVVTNVEADIPANSTRVRAVARDVVSGALGSVDLGLK